MVKTSGPTIMSVGIFVKYLRNSNNYHAFELLYELLDVNVTRTHQGHGIGIY